MKLVEAVNDRNTFSLKLVGLMWSIVRSTLVQCEKAGYHPVIAIITSVFPPLLYSRVGLAMELILYDIEICHVHHCSRNTVMKICAL